VTPANPHNRACERHFAMRSMCQFDPQRPSRLHDWVSDEFMDWHTGWADRWRADAVVEANGWAYFDGRILDGWEPLQVS